jgi:hypothetical protein
MDVVELEDTRMSQKYDSNKVFEASMILTCT